MNQSDGLYFSKTNTMKRVPHMEKFFISLFPLIFMLASCATGGTTTHGNATGGQVDVKTGDIGVNACIKMTGSEGECEKGK